MTLTTPIEGDDIVNAAEEGDVLAQGTAEAGAQVVVTFDDGTSTVTSTTVTATAGGAWTLTGNEVDLSGLADGSNNITVTATASDAAGNSATAASNISKDTTAPSAPTVTITEDANNDGVITGAELSGNVDVNIAVPGDAAVGESLVIDDGNGNTTTVTLTAGQIGSTVSVNFPAPPSGSAINVTATITDLAGNTSAAGNDSATVNTLIPTQAKRPVTATYRRIERNDGIDNSVKHHIRFSFK